MKVISFNATKGGTGKSTLSIITLNALTRAGFKCLALDMDMINHSLSFYYNSGIDLDTIQNKNIFKVFTGANINDNVIPINQTLDLIHSDVRLSDFRSIDTNKRLKQQIEKLKGAYDYIVIDTAPTWDGIICNVLHSSNYLFVPVIPDVFNFQSAKYLFDKLLEQELSSLDISVIFNQFEKPRTGNKETFSNQVIDIFKQDERISPFMCGSYVSKSSAIKKYINDKNYKINNRKETKKQFNEITELLNTTLQIKIDIKDL